MYSKQLEYGGNDEGDEVREEAKRKYDKRGFEDLRLFGWCGKHNKMHL